MKRILSKLSFAVVALAFSTQAHADLLLEPYLGYHTGKWKLTTSKYDMNGPTYGARVGYQTFGLMMGIDYMTGAWKDKTPVKQDIIPADLGVFIGYNLPVMLRVYAVLAPEFLKPTFKMKNSGSSSKFGGGQTMKLGVGFTFLPLVSLNLEMITGKYGEIDGQNMSSDLETTMYGLTVSLPLTF